MGYMHFLVEHCRLLIESHGSVYAALLVAGLVGSVTHCAGMCGPFVATQVAARLDGVPADTMREWHRLQGAALLPYHAGRITTYMFLGAVAAGFSSLFFASGYPAKLSAVMLAVAGVLFLLNGLGVARKTAGGSAAVGVIERFSTPLWLNPTGLRGYGLGIMLGFLPCGMVMAALMAVVTTGSALGGAVGMAAFGVGTVPALFLVGLGSHYAAMRWRKEMRFAARGAMMINGILLCTLAAEQVI